MSVRLSSGRQVTRKLTRPFEVWLLKNAGYRLEPVALGAGSVDDRNRLTNLVVLSPMFKRLTGYQFAPATYFSVKDESVCGTDRSHRFRGLLSIKSPSPCSHSPRAKFQLVRPVASLQALRHIKKPQSWILQRSWTAVSSGGASALVSSN